MIKINIKYLLWVFVPITLLVFFIFLVVVCKGQAITLTLLFGALSKTIVVLFFLATFFVTTAWKWRLFKGWLVKIPNLNGKWRGKIQSTYLNATEIPFTATIKQTFLTTNILLKTSESESKNIVATCDIDRDRGIRQLIYSYQNVPKATIQDRSAIHYGTTILNINENEDKLEGMYFTSRGTRGDIKLKKVNK